MGNGEKFYGQSNIDRLICRYVCVHIVIVQANQPCEQMIVNCQWQGVHYPCGDLVNPALTDEGVCCTFNRVPGKYMYHDPYVYKILTYFNGAGYKFAVIVISPADYSYVYFYSVFRWSLGDFNITYPYHTIDWTPEVGYPDNIPKDVWPFRPAGTNTYWILT